MSSRVRRIEPDELEQLLTLYQYLNPDDPELVVDKALEKHWQDILSDPNLYYWVIRDNGRIIASCTMAVIKNLTRSARPYGLIENVVTHPNYRKKGYGTALLKEAIAKAREQNCYKVMLMTSRKDEGTLNFYEQAGLSKGDKTGFIIRL